LGLRSTPNGWGENFSSSNSEGNAIPLGRSSCHSFVAILSKFDGTRILTQDEARSIGTENGALELRLLGRCPTYNPVRGFPAMFVER
jgi:hypothetical protein